MWVDALTYKDIIQVDGLNLNGTRRAIYINGKVDGLVRPENKGGDLITLPTAVFVGAIAADVLTVTSIARGVLSVGDLVSGDDVADATHVSAVLTGIGGSEPTGSTSPRTSPRRTSPPAKCGSSQWSSSSGRVVQGRGNAPERILRAAAFALC